MPLYQPGAQWQGWKPPTANPVQQPMQGGLMGQPSQSPAGAQWASNAWKPPTAQATATGAPQYDYSVRPNPQAGASYAPNSSAMPSGLSPTDQADWARSQGSGAASMAASAAATAAGNVQQSAQGNAMANASQAGAANAGAPSMNYLQQSNPQGFNTQYGTADNVSAYMNPYLQSIVNRGQSALNSYNPQQGTTQNLGAYGLNGYTPTLQQDPGRASTQTNALGAYGINGYDPTIGPQQQRQQATSANLDMYADPGYQFRLDQGMKALDSSAAARGGLLSSGHMQEATDYAQNAASQEYQNRYNRFTNDQNNIQNDQNTNNNFAANQVQNAFGRANTAGSNTQQDFNNNRNFTSGELQNMYGRQANDQSMGNANYQNAVNNGANAQNTAQNNFNTDRGYMTNQYNTESAANTAQSNWTNNFNADMYKYGNADYQGRLGDYYNQNNGQVNTGVNAANNSGTIYGNQGSNMAELYNYLGSIGAQSASNSGSNNSGLLGSLVQMAPALIAMMAAG